MSNEDRYPHFDFNFQKIAEYWKVTLGNYEAARAYLDIVEKRLQYWLQERGSWIDYGFAAKHLEEDLDIRDVESRLTWLALKLRVKLANEQLERLAPQNRGSDKDVLPIEVKLSADGRHDVVWHADFQRFYLRALSRERKKLERLRETGFIPLVAEATSQKSNMSGKPRSAERLGVQWNWTNRLLPYLFEALCDKEAVDDDGELWAALDGVFRDRKGRPITRKDLGAWAYQYHNNKAPGDEAGKPKNHESIDEIIEKIQGNS